VTIDVRPDLPKIERPTLVLLTHSKRRSQQELDSYRAGLRNGEFVTIPVDGYHAAGSAPDESARATLEFVTRNR
jgi:pimeloyl-ACP methyl ester carboxylesterase